MANPAYISDGQGERVDTLVDTSGTGYFKLGVGSKAISGATSNGGGTLVGTHTRAATLASGDPLVVAGGANPAAAAKEILVDTDGALAVPQYATTPTGLALVQAAGSLGAATYYYRVSATTATGETLACSEISLAIAATHGVTATWNAVPGATGYRVYGRTTGAETFIAAVGGTTLTYTDSGSISPSGALPSVNTARVGQVVEAAQSTHPTYVASVQGIATTSAAQVLVVEAPASSAIRLKRLVIVNVGQGTTGLYNFTLLRTTTASSAGSTITPAPLDLADGAYGGVSRSLPTAGTESTVLYNIPVVVPTAYAAMAPIVIDWDGVREAKAPVIAAGTANGIALKCPAITSGAGFACFMEFCLV
jgi:hypothetical protein